MNPPLRNAFVLGAGLGTRLRTLTERKPKPLIPICQKPLITFAFDHLIRYGVRNIVVNTHHQPETYRVAFPEDSYKGAALTFRHEDELLETAGGIKNVQDLLDGEPFVVHNGDVLSDLPIEQAVQHHFEHGNEVTMVLRSSGGPLQVALAPDGQLVSDIAGRISGVRGKYLFTGIYIINPEFFSRIPAGERLSVIPIFLKMIEQGQKLGAVVIDSGSWWDLGTREQYLNVHRYFAQPQFDFSIGRNGEWPRWIHPSASIGKGAKISGATAIGAGSVIGAGAELNDCVVWENVAVAPESKLSRCVVTAGRTASGTCSDSDL